MTAPAHQKLLSAEQSDPRVIGWMQGHPPAPDKIIRFSDSSFFSFPQLRWSTSHYRELVATKPVSKGQGASRALPYQLRDDLDDVSFQVMGQAQRMTWGQAFDTNYTDGILVMHHGKVVYEKYAGALEPTGQHMSFSITKSFTGILAAMLVANGQLDEHALVAHYIPELAQSAFGNASVRQIMDMTTGLAYSEDYVNPQADIWQHARAGGVLPALPSVPTSSESDGKQAARSFYDFLKTVKPQGEHGQAFSYKTVNSDVLGWLISRITQQALNDHVSATVWQHLGAEQDAYYTNDGTGVCFAGGGLNTGLRDLARFGEVMRCEGASSSGHQIVPASVVNDIRAGADRAHFQQAGLATLGGWSYRNMWWVSHNAHGAYMARGIHGQALYIDPTANMVIARYASHPLASNIHLDPCSLPAYHALAVHLMRG
jgi:CubicO group peptidase (beta-lactamase class C family)